MCSVRSHKEPRFGTPHSRTPCLWQPYSSKSCIPGDHCSQDTGRKSLDTSPPHSCMPYPRQPCPRKPYSRKPCIPGKHCAEKLAPKKLDLAHHILEPLTQGYRILGHRIRGNNENVETVVLRTPHQRMYILAHHILECCNQGNSILGNHILGNHSLETIVLNTQPPRI